MTLDTSVLLQILFDEPQALDAVALLAGAEDLIVAAPTVLEAEIVWGARRGYGGREVRTLLRRIGATGPGQARRPLSPAATA